MNKQELGKARTHPGFGLILSIGEFSGCSVFWGKRLWRICAGWVSLIVMRHDVDHLLADLEQENERLRLVLKQFADADNWTEMNCGFDDSSETVWSGVSHHHPAEIAQAALTEGG